jgi:hypothetical protein
VKVDTWCRGQKNKHVEKKHKIIVIGDSHARGCAAEIKLNLDEGFEVQGFVTPGTGANTVTTSAKSDIQHLSKQDVVVVWGGSKDVGKNETKKGIKCIQRFVKTNNHTNFILMDIPHRYDLERTSCVNKEVERYNRRIRKHMKVFENTEVMKIDLEEVSQTWSAYECKGKGIDGKKNSSRHKTYIKGM